MYPFAAIFIDCPRFSSICIDFRGVQGFRGQKVCRPVPPCAAGLGALKEEMVQSCKAEWVDLMDLSIGGLRAWRLGAVLKGELGDWRLGGLDWILMTGGLDWWKKWTVNVV